MREIRNSVQIEEDAPQAENFSDGHMSKENGFRAGVGLKAKFLVWLVFFVLVVMIIVYVYFSNHERVVLSKEIRLRGEAICKNLQASAEDFLVMGDDLALAKLVYDTKTKNEDVVYCFVIDDQNRIWAHTDMTMVDREYVPPGGLQGIADREILSQRYRTPNGTEVFEIAMPVEVAGSKIGEARVAISVQAIQDAVAHARRGIAFVTAGIIVFGIIGILILVSFIIGPLGKVTDDIEAIGDGNLDRSIVTRRRDEIGRIAHAVGTMAKKLKKAREEMIEKERMRKEMQIAKEIQQTLLPTSVPRVRGLSIDSYYQSAMEVGGDYYDFVDIDDDHFGILIGDVSGKGVAGSLVMAMVKSTVRIEALKNPSPHHVISFLNSILSNDIPEDMFITLFYAVFNLKDYQMSYCCAGHNPAYLFSPSEGRLSSLKPEGSPVGMVLFDEKQYASRLKEEKLYLKPDDILLLYTDGVTEAKNGGNNQFGTERLEQFIERHGGCAPDEVKSALRAEIESFTGNTPQSDDITFVVLRRE